MAARVAACHSIPFDGHRFTTILVTKTFAGCFGGKRTSPIESAAEVKLSVAIETPADGRGSVGGGRDYSAADAGLIGPFSPFRSYFLLDRSFGLHLQRVSIFRGGKDSRMPAVCLVWMNSDERTGDVDFCLSHIGQLLCGLFLFLHQFIRFESLIVSLKPRSSRLGWPRVYRHRDVRDFVVKDPLLENFFCAAHQARLQTGFAHVY